MTNQYQWLQQLYEENARTVYRLAVYRLYKLRGSAEEAEDVLQDVFLLAMQHDISKHPHQIGWLVRTTMTVCRKYWRRDKRHSEKERRYADRNLDGGAEGTLFFAASRVTGLDEVEDVLQFEQCLSTEEWALLRAYALEGIPVQELAARCHMSVSAVRVRIHRMRAKVKRFYTDD